MNSRGIRILDHENNTVSVALSDILNEIRVPEAFQWSILYLSATGNLGEGISMSALQEKINKSNKGLLIDWDELNLLAKKFFQIIDITIISCVNVSYLHRDATDQEMYEKCNTVIEMIDSGYWEVFSKDNDLIERLASKFKQIKFLSTDFEK